MNDPNNTNSSIENSSSRGQGQSATSGVPSSGQGNAFRADATATLTVTETNSSSSPNHEVLQLTLRPRASVRWEEDVLDNEGLGRKSSKRCCIFHKQREFGESSTDSSEEEHTHDSDGSSSSGGPTANAKPIARKKVVEVNPKKVPDYQRFHA